MRGRTALLVASAIVAGAALAAYHAFGEPLLPGRWVALAQVPLVVMWLLRYGRPGPGAAEEQTAMSRGSFERLLGAAVLLGAIVLQWRVGYGSGATAVGLFLLASIGVDA